MKTAMRAAFENAQVKANELPQVAKRVLRVMKRADAARANARARRKQAGK
jgi:hypothetical protein